MSTAYVECPQCGRRALSVATRCPHCGVDFPPRPLHRPAAVPGPTRFRPLLVAAGLLAAGTALATAVVHRGGPPAQVQVRVPDTVVPGPPRAAAPEAVARPPDSTAEPRAAAEAPPRPEHASPAAPRAWRYARTWTNVRIGRDRSTAPVAVLNPGDSVVVDSLRRGWYRVLAVDGRTLGYAARTTLADRPPAAGR